MAPVEYNIAPVHFVRFLVVTYQCESMCRHLPNTAWHDSRHGTHHSRHDQAIIVYGVMGGPVIHCYHGVLQDVVRCCNLVIHDGSRIHQASRYVLVHACVRSKGSLVLFVSGMN